MSPSARHKLLHAISVLRTTPPARLSRRVGNSVSQETIQETFSSVPASPQSEYVQGWGGLVCSRLPRELRFELVCWLHTARSLVNLEFLV
ncbi:uncharacterized protein MYCFIDRAFT_172019 [Pseudocercospora fijiensis CIRAD86]|uniref:Uncharacterized protein n=1 Tax=Pseudocercospora fijiensis (strain CIRAD86) TaxID=383855 RepID=M3ANT4_PSEFD|nr:uncharacterized protein MYCFIDRAFT_172019 [Pseudocercospora fijiensis CIRAD86]EME86241.1 hypothetical protein MYCFIDRAFT_172019 [Pseudocercospora fijiensis CIRAD86]